MSDIKIPRELFAKLINDFGVACQAYGYAMADEVSQGLINAYFQEVALNVLEVKRALDTIYAEDRQP